MSMWDYRYRKYVIFSYLDNIEIFLNIEKIVRLQSATCVNPRPFDGETTAPVVGTISYVRVSYKSIYVQYITVYSTVQKSKTSYFCKYKFCYRCRFVTDVSLS